MHLATERLDHGDCCVGCHVGRQPMLLDILRVVFGHGRRRRTSFLVLVELQARQRHPAAGADCENVVSDSL